MKNLPTLRLSAFASVKLTVALLTLIATTVLVGAWCPQESQVGQEKVFETFGPQMAEQLIRFGISDIFHTPFFLALIGLLTVNMVACSVQRVFPKVNELRRPMVFLNGGAISKLAVSLTRKYPVPADLALNRLQNRLASVGYKINIKDTQLTAHWGKYGRLAPTITHIGLLSLLAGVTITSWTGFSGFQPIFLGDTMSFAKSEHSKLWIGQLPEWSVRVDATHKETYTNGEAKQWYSTLSVVDKAGKVLKTQEISVNNPLSYKNVDIYQSSWGLGQIVVSFNKQKLRLPLRQMGPVINAAFLPLDKQTIMMFSVHGQDEPVRVFGKIPEWRSPQILTVLMKGQPVKLGNVELCYDRLIPVTGLQYKCDPGLPITYVAFGFIIVGVMLAAVPYRQVWASIEPGENGTCTFSVGGVSRKAKGAFERALNKIVDSLDQEFEVGSALQTEFAVPTKEEVECQISN